jgi:hypothetical protein
MTTIHHISASSFQPRVSLTTSGRIKSTFGDTSISMDISTVEEYIQDLEAARARLIVLEDKQDFALAE